MKCMERNKIDFYYALYIDKIPITDDYGNKTGEYEIIRSNPFKSRANISAAKGETQTRQFGENEAYDKVMVLDELNTDIDEYSVLWVDTVPELGEDGALALDTDGEVKTPYDYIVIRKAVSLNSVSIAIRKVDVS